MALFVNRLEPTVIDLRINLGGPNAGMAEKLLQRTNFRTSRQHVRRKTVT